MESFSVSPFEQLASMLKREAKEDNVSRQYLKTGRASFTRPLRKALLGVDDVLLTDDACQKTTCIDGPCKAAYASLFLECGKKI